MFPIGNLEKKRVREIALEAGLATATKKDSTGFVLSENVISKNF